MLPADPVNGVKTVFMFGQSGSGKSTICASVALAFHSLKGIVPLVHSVANRDGASLIRQWISRLRKGEFPARTETQTFLDFTIGFQVINSEQRLEIRFLEVAGERVIQLDPLHDRYSVRDDRLDDFLQQADGVILVASTDPLENDRFILQGFAEHLLEKEVALPVCLVVSEWDRVSGTGVGLIEYVNANYSEVARHVAHRGGDLLSFSVGEVSGDDNRIEKFSLNDGTADLIDWINNLR
jgi:energy-coupling factor transporter ATP-binding protein EcfA2